MRLNFFSKTATLAVFEKSIEKFILPCILSDIGIFLYSILPPLRLAFRLIRYPFSMRAVCTSQGRNPKIQHNKENVFVRGKFGAFQRF